MIHTHHTVEPADSVRYCYHSPATGSPTLRTAEGARHEISNSLVRFLHTFRGSFFFSKYLFKGEFVKRGKKTDLFFFPALVQPARSLANTEGYSPCAASVRTLAASALLPV